MLLLDQWEDYITGLCQYHKGVKHGDGGKRAFIKMGSDESPTNSNKLSSPYIRHDNFFGSGTKETLWVFTSELLFLVNVSATKGNLEEQIQLARAQSFELVSDFEARMREDHDAGDICGLLADLYEPDVQPIGPVDQSAYGWRLTVKMASYKADFEPKKWSDHD